MGLESLRGGYISCSLKRGMATETNGTLTRKRRRREWRIRYSGNSGLHKASCENLNNHMPLFSYSSLLYVYFYFGVCVCFGVCMCVHICTKVWRSENNSVESILSFHF